MFSFLILLLSAGIEYYRVSLSTHGRLNWHSLSRPIRKTICNLGKHLIGRLVTTR